MGFFSTSLCHITSQNPLLFQTKNKTSGSPSSESDRGVITAPPIKWPKDGTCTPLDISAKTNDRRKPNKMLSTRATSSSSLNDAKVKFYTLQ